MKKFRHKVICIGWHKTGTSTLGDALLELGYTVVGARLDMAEPLLKGDIGYALNVANEFEAFQDVPWAALYKELDDKFPGSKFILTLREPHKWLESAKKHFRNLDIEMHTWLYGNGVLEGNEELYLERYNQHNKDVITYFSGRSNDFLIMNLEQGDGWRELCTFLNCAIPSKKFPHANKGKHNYNHYEKLIYHLKSMIPGRWRLSIKRILGLPDRRNRFNNHIENAPFVGEKNKKHSESN